ncbi:MAG: type II toxin-antitoxin system HicB family antitoxin [Nitrospiraceae bacterium]|nr:type II toxin-antitoxin system HicB family antitoxin [Nitrospiraceae bacterium]
MQKEKKYEVTLKGTKYAVVLHPDTEDGGFWIECPSLPGCASQGDSVEEALEMMKDAIEGHLAVAGSEKVVKKAS